MRAGAFSLVELVIVIVIIAVIAAIAVPRVTTASRRARENTLEATTATIQQAMELYKVDHGKYPGYDPASGAANHTNFSLQLTLYSDGNGNTQTTFGAPFLYGPYLRAPFPMNPINGLNSVFVKPTPSAPALPQGVGWIAVLSTGDFEPGAPETTLEGNEGEGFPGRP